MRRIRSKETEEEEEGGGGLDGGNGGEKEMRGGRFGGEAIHTGACSSCVTSTRAASSPAVSLSLSPSPSQSVSVNGQLKSVTTINPGRGSAQLHGNQTETV